MAKRGRKSKEHKHAEHTESSKIHPHLKGYDKTIMLLIENNVGLQKKLLGLTESIDELTKKVSRLLSLIEKASENYIGGEGVEKGIIERKSESGSKVADKELVDKLEGLIKQNKMIARGLILLERFVREKTRGESAKRERESEELKPLPEYKFD